MALDLSPWVALVIGILIGWLSGWFLDWWFDRRRQTEADGRQAELEEMLRQRDLELANVQALANAQTLAVDSAEPLPDNPEAGIEEEPLPPHYGEHLADLSTPAVEVEVVDEEGVEEQGDDGGRA